MCRLGRRPAVLPFAARTGSNQTGIRRPIRLKSPAACLPFDSIRQGFGVRPLTKQVGPSVEWLSNQQLSASSCTRQLGMIVCIAVQYNFPVVQFTFL